MQGEVGISTFLFEIYGTDIDSSNGLAQVGLDAGTADIHGNLPARCVSHWNERPRLFGQVVGRPRSLRPNPDFP